MMPNVRYFQYIFEACFIIIHIFAAMYFFSNIERKTKQNKQTKKKRMEVW